MHARATRPRTSTEGSPPRGADALMTEVLNRE